MRGSGQNPIFLKVESGSGFSVRLDPDPVVLEDRIRIRLKSTRIRIREFFLNVGSGSGSSVRLDPDPVVLEGRIRVESTRIRIREFFL